MTPRVVGAAGFGSPPGAGASGLVAASDAGTSGQNQDPQQAAIQKSMTTVMPVMITVTFLFVPIPAGVLLYLVTSNIFQIIQTVIINKQLEKEDENKKANSAKDAVIDAKVIESK